MHRSSILNFSICVFLLWLALLFALETLPLSLFQSCPSPSSWHLWSSQAEYPAGTILLFNGRLYQARKDCRGQLPDNQDAWEDLHQKASTPPKISGKITPVYPSAEDEETKLVGYFPSWHLEEAENISWASLTHIIYAFALPRSDGTVEPFENPEEVHKLVKEAHRNQVKILLGVGGWGNKGEMLAPAFAQATQTADDINVLAGNIVSVCEEYGFDGVDLDWEYPQTEDGTWKQYEALMEELSFQLHKTGKVLTSAVLGGVTETGEEQPWARAYSDTALSYADWIHIMAYDASSTGQHSSYEFAKGCGDYWKNERGLPPSRIILGVPFYGRPGFASYRTLTEEFPDADAYDSISFHGSPIYYNGAATIRKKSEYARDELGGIMVWEITQDSADPDKSLLTLIHTVLNGDYSFSLYQVH